MDAADIDLAPMKSAIERLEEGLAVLAREPENTLLRDGVIQRFEFTYELSHRLLRRYLASIAANPEEVQTMSFQDLVRLGGDQGMLRSEWARWRTFHQARTDTSHTYDEAKARQVLPILPAFLAEVKALVTVLASRKGRP